MAQAVTDASIASASGASETIIAGTIKREWVRISNPHASVTWWINESGGTAAANAAGSMPLAPGESMISVAGNKITGIATAATPLTVVYA